jgi:hypothetical protein
MENLANENGLGRNRARDFLKSGVQSGTIKVRREGRRRHHFWREAEGAADDPDPQASVM